MLRRHKLAMLASELLGTAILTLVVLSISRSQYVGIWYFTALVAGLAVSMLTLALGAISGGYFNPAITLGMWTIGKIKTSKAILFVAMQLVGAWAAYLIYSYLMQKGWSNTGKFDAHLLVAEIVGTFIFAFGFAAAIYQHTSPGIKAALIGSALTIGLAAVAIKEPAGAFLNPAVALGARSWVWGVYVAGPIIGAVIAFNLYSLLFGVRKTTGAAEATVEEVVVATPAIVEGPIVTRPARSETKTKLVTKKKAITRKKR